MLLAETIALAAKRWMALLCTSSLTQAWSIIRADASYTDLTKTQYSAALEWLKTQKFVVATEEGIEQHPHHRMLSSTRLNELLFEHILATSELPWLPDADTLIPDPSELPQDASKIATVLGLSDEMAFHAVRRVHGKIDLERRAIIGAAGEKALLSFLEARWPGASTHVSETSDGFGYDLACLQKNVEWHLEVKSTTRRGRLTVHLSRNEFEVGKHDPNWRLIIVGLDQRLKLRFMATAKFPQLASRAPLDTCAASKWQSASFQLGPDDVTEGLNFLGIKALD